MKAATVYVTKRPGFVSCRILAFFKYGVVKVMECRVDLYKFLTDWAGFQLGERCSGWTIVRKFNLAIKGTPDRC